jgi:quercetin dioxygenase-like cupin family protein
LLAPARNAPSIRSAYCPGNANGSDIGVSVEEIECHDQALGRPRPVRDGKMAACAAPLLRSTWPASRRARRGQVALWRLDGEDLQANLVRLGVGDRIQPHRNDEVDVLVVVISGRGELALGGRVHSLAPMALVHVPKGTVRAVAAVDGPLAYLSVHRRRLAGLQVGRQAQRR